MVVPGGVEGQFPQERSVGVENADVKVANEDQDAGAGIAATEADVVQAAVVPQADHSGAVDAVVADAVVAGVDRGAGGDCGRAGGVGLAGGAAVQCAVRPDGVVVAAELIKLGLELSDGDRAGLSVEPFLQGLVESFDLAAGLRVIGAGMGEPDPASVTGDLQGDPAAAAGSAGEHRAVVRQQARWVAVGAGRGRCWSRW